MFALLTFVQMQTAAAATTQEQTNISTLKLITKTCSRSFWEIVIEVLIEVCT